MARGAAWGLARACCVQQRSPAGRGGQGLAGWQGGKVAGLGWEAQACSRACQSIGGRLKAAAWAGEPVSVEARPQPRQRRGAVRQGGGGHWLAGP
jgi:hypothetical protein